MDMDKLPMLHLTAVALTGIYGLVSLVGGTIGYLKANSMPSLVAGGIAGILLLLCAFGITRWPLPSLIGATVVSLALVGRFAPKALGVVEKAAGPVDYLMSLGGVLVIVACLLAMFMAPRPPGA
jgi:uncharacterized membrane protein (UPF0136 family)